MTSGLANSVSGQHCQGLSVFCSALLSSAGCLCLRVDSLVDTRELLLLLTPTYVNILVEEIRLFRMSLFKREETFPISLAGMCHMTNVWAWSWASLKNLAPNRKVDAALGLANIITGKQIYHWGSVRKQEEK